MEYAELSKEISYILRHAPHEYGLTLDEQGWVGLDELILVLKEKKKIETLLVSDIEDMICASEKKRHEIQNGKIRALYGHSIKEKITKEVVKPPDILYHGTAHKFVENILVVGLIPKNRQYIHLSEDDDTAVIVSKRRDGNPLVLKIDSRRAWEDGIIFYLGNENIWLADTVPPKYISFL